MAGLPSELDPEGEEAKQFDRLVLNLELAMLRSEPAFVRLRDQVREFAALLEEKAAIPMVREQMALIQDVQTDAWWQDVTVAMLEGMRRRLRELIKLIEKQKRKPIYTDFEDEMGGETSVELPGFTEGADYAKFRAKAQAFPARASGSRRNSQAADEQAADTAADLSELERMLMESSIGAAEDIRRAANESQGLGLSLRTLTGCVPLRKDAHRQPDRVRESDREPPDAARVMETAMLYESPFTDLTPRGPDGLFTSAQVDELMRTLDAVRATAVAA